MEKLIKSNWVVGVIVLAAIAGCVPTKKLTYLQSSSMVQPAYDSVMATYSVNRQPYKLKAEDIISLRVASVTGDKYNFIKQYEEDLGIIRKLNQYDQGNSQTGGGSQQLQRQAMGGGGDEGGISVLMLDRMNTGFVLDSEGGLELPEIGRLFLSGLTIPEAEQKVKESLDGYFETPMVRIQLLNYHFTVVGEVNNEGRYTSFDPNVTIFDAITLAGNLTEFADRANLKIIRQEEGESKVIYINTLDETTLQANNYFLKRGDLIVVPPLNARTANRYTLPNLSRTLGIVSAALSLAALIISLGK